MDNVKKFRFAGELFQKKVKEQPNAIKINKKRTPGTSGKTVPGAIFLYWFVWDIAQMTVVFP